MVRRHPGSPFMPGALVFLGGGIDDDDASPEIAPLVRGLDEERAARTLGLPPEQRQRALVHYVAAVREGFEEGGLLCTCPSLGPGPLAELRAARAAGHAGLSALLRERGLLLDLGGLRYLDHWLTPEVESRRYDARFFVARAPAGQDAEADPRETSSGDWLTIEEALSGHLDGCHALPPPTLVILERLRGLASVDALLAAAPDAPVSCTMPRLLLAPGSTEVTLLLPADARYHEPATVGGPEDVVVLVNGRWQHRSSTGPRHI
jgi:8-oxo-dGTP pyrophosphatase MutT (NUDIX family)